MPIAYQIAHQLASNLARESKDIHRSIARQPGESALHWLSTIWTVLAGGGDDEALALFSDFPSELACATAYSGLKTLNSEADQALAWWPEDRLRQIQVRLRRAQVERAKVLFAQPDWGLRALASAPEADFAAGMSALPVLILPVLLVGSLASGLRQGCLARFHLWRWHCPPAPGDRVAAAHRARLHLLPTLTEACIQQTKRFVQGLETVAH